MILGLVQGITEFLPVSSSGHLVIFQNLLGMSEPQVLFDVMLHVGTLVAILIVFRRDVIELIRAGLRILASRKLGDQPGDRLLVAIVIGSIPTAIIGFLFKNQLEAMFASITAVGIGLIITGLALMATALRERRETSEQERLANPEEVSLVWAQHAAPISLVQAVLVGIAQGIAIAPGISRSGATIAVALILGVPRELAARFSFLLAIPAIVGALALELKDYSPAANAATATSSGSMFTGALVAAISGIIALMLLLRIVRRGKISLFAYYCWVVGLLAIIIGIFKG